MRNGPVLDRYVPDEDATVLERVLDAGAIILGKAVCESLCSPGQPQPHRRLVYGRTAAAGEARDEVHDAAQDRPDPIGSVTIDGKVFEHDVLIRLGGQVEKRKKRLSKAVYGTSHTISLAEAKHLYQKGAARLLIGAGQHGTVGLSEEAASYFQPPPPGGAAADAGGDPGLEPAEGAVIAMLHVTC